MATVTKECPECDGTGELEDECGQCGSTYMAECEECEGTGKIDEEEE